MIERRRLSLGELYLMVSAGSAIVMASLLLIAPPRLTTGPALATVYGIASRDTWGVCFSVLALLCAVGAWRPSEVRFLAVIVVVVVAQTLWAVGLTMPGLNGADTANLLAPVAWVQLAATTLLVARTGRREAELIAAARGALHPTPRPVLPRRAHRRSG